jgi:uncharacterized delta-60 repeat protein
MKIQIALAILIGIAMIACTQNEPATVKTSVLEPIGYGSITFVDDSRGQPTLNLQSKALNGYASGFIEVKRISVNSFTVGARPSATSVGGYRYVSFTYAVRNAANPVSPATSGVASSVSRSNLTFVPISISGAGGTLSSPLITPIRSLGKFDGSPASASIAQEVQPTHGSRFNPFTGQARVNDDQADLQVFTESEMSNLTTSTPSWPSTYSPFPYGYVVRARYNPSNRILGANPPVGQFDGLVTFGFKVPLQPGITDDPFVYNVQFVIAQDSVARVTKSNEESNATRAQAEATSLAGSAVVDSSVCQVRYAGAPGAFESKYLTGFGAKGALSGTLDHCFGANGSTQLRFSRTMNPNAANQGNAVVLRPDGKILVAGPVGNDYGHTDFAVLEFNPDGALGFIGNASNFNFDLEPFAIALQPDGRILLAGRADNADTYDQFALARFNASGALDSSFGFDGQVTLDFNGSPDQAKALVLQPDGKMLLAGNSYDPISKYDFAVARFNANGTLDSSFGTGGKVRVDFGGRSDFANAMALQPDGKIVLAGSTTASTPTSANFGLTRLNSNGTLDTGFGVTGMAMVDFASSYDIAKAMVLQSDGKILVAGQATSPYTKFGMARLTLGGVLDSSFGTGGKVTRSTYGYYDSANAIALQADGKILLGGATRFAAGSDSDFMLARFNSSGSVDSSFAGNTSPVPFSNAGIQLDDQINGVAIQADGRILVVGTGADANSDSGSLILARYNP